VFSANKQAVLRPVESSDAEIMSAIHRESFPIGWEARKILESLAVAGTHGSLALMPEPSGFIIWRNLYEQSEIITLAVLPDVRRQGIARLLLAHAMQHAAQSKAQDIFLEVEEGNIAAFRLYEQSGFELVNRRDGYYRKPDGTYADALVMSRELA
jgi:ribosomal-protein-alanine N-acetyltransferase